jgi:hypothetical protein
MRRARAQKVSSSHMMMVVAPPLEITPPRPPRIRAQPAAMPPQHIMHRTIGKTTTISKMPMMMPAMPPPLMDAVADVVYPTANGAAEGRSELLCG